MAESQATERTDLRVVHNGGDTGPQEAMALLEHAHRVAEDTLTSARAESERLLMAARHEAQQLRTTAREQAEREVSEAGHKAETTRAQAQEEADRLLTEARSKLAQIGQEKDRLAKARDQAADSVRELAQHLLETVSADQEHSSDEHSDSHEH